MNGSLGAQWLGFARVGFKFNLRFSGLGSNIGALGQLNSGIRFTLSVLPPSGRKSCNSHHRQVKIHVSFAGKDVNTVFEHTKVCTYFCIVSLKYGNVHIVVSGLGLQGGDDFAGPIS